MAKKHDQAGRVVAKKLGGQYDPTASPDVKGKQGRAEVKTMASEIPKAKQQLGTRPGKAYVVLPKPEHGKARDRLRGSGVGLMNYKGEITKRSGTGRKKT